MCGHNYSVATLSMQWTVGIMWSTGRLMLIFVLFTLTSFTQAFKESRDMDWNKNPEEAWPYSEHHCEHKVVILLLDEPEGNKDWTFIASGVLIDNNRILTSYNPFRDLLPDPKAEKIVALVPIGSKNKLTKVKIANIECGRQIVYEPDDEKKKSFWRYKEHCPTHDLMIVRIEEEFGVAMASFRLGTCFSPEQASLHDKGNWDWDGQLPNGRNAIVSALADLIDVIEPEVQIFTLGYMSKKQMKDFDTIHEITFEADDAALVDCDEWLPRQWGFFICIRNVGNFPGLGSGATLYSKNKLFGIGNFAMFKNDTGILVFTDIRPYRELIAKTCGDEEFI